MNLYIISSDSYMAEDSAMYEFEGTFRELLRHLLGEDPAVDPDSSLTDDELLERFNDANGDGQPYSMAYSLAEHKKVLG
jgi:hypothetical protein